MAAITDEYKISLSEGPPKRGLSLDNVSSPALVKALLFLDMKDQLAASFVSLRWNHLAMNMRTQHHIWRTLPTDDRAAPPPRRGHASVLVPDMNSILVYGGYAAAGFGHVNDIWALDLKSLIWSELEASGTKPPGTSFHSCTLVDGNRFFVFGGYRWQNGGHEYNDIYIFDLKSRVWEKPTVSGTPPSVRESHTATLVGDEIFFLFGMEDETVAKQDVHLFNVRTLTWSQPKVEGDVPAGRYGHSATLLPDGRRILIFGGADAFNGEVHHLDDVHLLEKGYDSVCRFTQIQPDVAPGQSRPSGRRAHTAALLHTNVIFIGGMIDGDFNQSDETLVMDVSVDPPRWSAAVVQSNAVLARYAHSMNLLDNDTLMIFAGSSAGNTKYTKGLNNDVAVLTRWNSSFREFEKIIEDNRRKNERSTIDELGNSIFEFLSSVNPRVQWEDVRLDAEADDDEDGEDEDSEDEQDESDGTDEDDGGLSDEPDDNEDNVSESEEEVDQEALAWNFPKLTEMLNKEISMLGKGSYKVEDFFKLFRAAAVGDHEAIQEILEKDGSLCMAKNDKGFTALHKAAQSKRADAARVLLEAGCKITATDKEGNTALHVAASLPGGNVDVVGELLKHVGSSVNRVNNSGETALIRACKDSSESSPSIVSMILNASGDVNICDKSGRAALHYACQNTSGSDEVEKVVTSLLDAGALVDAADSDGRTALSFAAEHGNVRITELLLKRGASGNTRSGDGDSPLMFASRNNHIEVAETLLKSSGVDLNTQNKDGMSALHIAVSTGHSALAKLLIVSDADYYIRTNQGLTVFDLAIERFEKEQDSSLLDALKKNFAFSSAKFVSFNDLSNISVLGSGNFGITYRADMCVAKTDHGEVTVPVVCKVPKKASGEDDWYELQTLQNVPNHRHVVGLLALCLNFRIETVNSAAKAEAAARGNSALRPAVIILCAEGGSLHSHLSKRKAPLSPLRTAQFGLDMAKAVRHLHASGFVHCDIAARNFLLSEIEHEDEPDEAQRLLLTDFGLTRPVDLVQQEGEKRLLPWRWCAPETMMRNVSDLKSDVWMLGVALWELMSPRFYPYHWIPNPVILAGFYRERTNAPLIFPRGSPDDLKQLVLDCCSINPQDRPSSDAVVKRLEALVTKYASEPISSEKTASVTGEQGSDGTTPPATESEYIDVEASEAEDEYWETTSVADAGADYAAIQSGGPPGSPTDDSDYSEALYGAVVSDYIHVGEESSDEVTEEPQAENAEPAPAAKGSEDSTGSIYDDFETSQPKHAGTYSFKDHSRGMPIKRLLNTPTANCFLRYPCHEGGVRTQELFRVLSRKHRCLQDDQKSGGLLTPQTCV